MDRLKRLLLPALLVLAVYYALFGGQYSVFELGGAHRDRAAAAEELERLRQENDSLRAWADSLGTDPGVLERFAREQFGMIRDGEGLYRFADPHDSAAVADTSVTGR